MKITALQGQFGAEITGIYPDRLDADIAADLRNAIYRHRLVVVRSGTLTPEDHVAIMSLLGPVLYEDRTGLPYADVSTKPGAYIFGARGSRFHSDYQFTEGGAVSFVSLYAIVMERKEPTLYVDMVAALRRLPPQLRARLQGMSAVQCADYTPGVGGTVRADLSRMGQGQEALFPHSIHPAITKHPITGEELLNISAFFTAELVGLDRGESLALLDEIDSYVSRPDYIHPHEYEVEDLVIWDNIALQHGRPPLVDESSRHLRRVAVGPVTLSDGVRPVDHRAPQPKAAPFVSV